MRHRFVLACVLFMSLLAARQAIGQGFTYDTVALTGLTHHWGVYVSPTNASINSAGQVLFTDQSSAYRNSGGTTTRIAYFGQVADNTGESLRGPGLLAMNDAGQAVWHTAPIGSFGSVIVVGNGVTTEIVLRGADALPGGGTLGDPADRAFAMNSAGQVLVHGVPRTPAVLIDHGVVKRIMATGDASPVSGSIINQSFGHLNDDGHVALMFRDSSGVHVGFWDGAAVQPVAISGQSLAGGGTLAISPIAMTDDRVRMNSQAQIAFLGGINGSPANSGLFIVTPDGDVDELVRNHDLLPDGNGRFDAFSEMALNNHGQLVFRSTLKNTDGSVTSPTGVYLADEMGVRKIARGGDAALDGNGEISGFLLNALTINDLGQVAFLASLANTAGGVADNQALYATDLLGELRQVVRKGDLFDVDADPLVTDWRTISAINFESRRIGGLDGNFSRLSHRGALVFRLEFTDGTSGIFTATVVPTPAAAPIALLLITAVMLRRRA